MGTLYVLCSKSFAMTAVDRRYVPPPSWKQRKGWKAPRFTVSRLECVFPNEKGVAKRAHN
jgi:hypothetical protein